MSIRVIDSYLSERLKSLQGKDRRALIMEFKEWLIEENSDGVDIWTIPDLTDEGLCDFFKRAISKNSF
ncbi:hypothetical protein EV11_1218 [Prochlorococcus sp. SS52]|nr:hypothetical protein EV11_1218 [Prochlorococcus sp. SS52]